MPYTKPQVDILGDAKSLVALTGFKPLVFVEDGGHALENLYSSI